MKPSSSTDSPRNGFDVNSFLKKTLSNYDVEKQCDTTHSPGEVASSSSGPRPARTRSSSHENRRRAQHSGSTPDETRTISNSGREKRGRSIPNDGLPDNQGEARYGQASPTKQRTSRATGQPSQGIDPGAQHHYAKRSSRKDRPRKPSKRIPAGEPSIDESKQLLSQKDYPRELYHPSQHEQRKHRSHHEKEHSSQPSQHFHPHNQGFQQGHPENQGHIPQQGLNRELMPVLNSEAAPGLMKMSPSRVSLVSGASTLRPACRICQVPGEENDELISPCRCSGTMQFVHTGCLVHWLEISTKKMHPSPHCELCGYRYQAHHCCSLRRLQYPECSSRDRALHFVFLLVFIVMLGCAALSILYLKADGGNSLRQQLSLDDIVVITCSLLFFCSFFVAVFTQYRSEASLCRLFLRCWLINRHWRIKNYDRRLDPEYQPVIMDQPEPI